MRRESKPRPNDAIVVKKSACQHGHLQCLVAAPLRSTTSDIPACPCVVPKAFPERPMFTYDALEALTRTQCRNGEADDSVARGILSAAPVRAAPSALGSPGRCLPKGRCDHPALQMPDSSTGHNYRTWLRDMVFTTHIYHAEGACFMPSWPPNGSRRPILLERPGGRKREQLTRIHSMLG